MKSVGFIVLISLGSTCFVAGQDIVLQGATCPSCEIHVRNGALIPASGSDHGIAGEPRAIHHDAAGNFLVADRPLPAVYDQQGRFVTSLGRVGGGPGEFRYPSIPIPLPDDSVLVLDIGQRRATVLDPYYQFVRQISLPGAFVSASVRHWPDSVLVSGILPSPERFGWPLHLVSLASDEAAIRKSAGPDDRGAFVSTDRVGVTGQPDTTFWTHHSPYRLYEWDSALEVVRSFTREPDWWITGDPNLPLGLPRERPPSSYVAAVSVGADGLLWIFSATAAPDWENGWLAPRGSSEVRPDQVDYETLYDTMVEVVDPVVNELLTSKRIPERVVAPLPGGRAVAYLVSSAGSPQLTILEFEVKGR
ncbi:MAG: hypothetical protein WEA24_09720 [Gemmatimonadota bacterium]